MQRTIAKSVIEKKLLNPFFGTHIGLKFVWGVKMLHKIIPVVFDSAKRFSTLRRIAQEDSRLKKGNSDLGTFEQVLQSIHTVLKFHHVKDISTMV